MKLFDPHIHMTSRTTDDYQAMAEAGIAAVIEPAFWTGQPRAHVGSFEDYFRSLTGWERFRARQFGIHHFCALALNPKEANDPGVAEGVLELLPAYLQHESVVAIGEIGFDDQTPAEVHVFERQLDLALSLGLPALIHLPHKDKKAGTERTIDVVKASGIEPGRVLIDHNTEETTAMVLDGGYWAGHTVYPHTKLSEERVVAIIQRFGVERITVNSSADWGVSDPLKVPKTVQAMREAGIGEDDIETIAWRNPIEFFSQSGRLSAAHLQTPPKIDQSELWLGNTVLRGQPAVKSDPS